MGQHAWSENHKYTEFCLHGCVRNCSENWEIVPGSFLSGYVTRSSPMLANVMRSCPMLAYAMRWCSMLSYVMRTCPMLDCIMRSSPLLAYVMRPCTMLASDHVCSYMYTLFRRLVFVAWCMSARLSLCALLDCEGNQGMQPTAIIWKLGVQTVP